MDIWWRTLAADPDSPPAVSDEARGLLRGVLRRYLDEAPEAIRLVEGPHGKPAIEGPAPVSFNFSHSGRAAVFAVAGCAPVGVDCEAVIFTEDLGGVAEISCSAAEREWLAADGEGEFTERFFRLWTRKEAVIKAVGLGLSLPVSEIGVLGEGLTRVAVPGHGPWWVTTIDAPAGYAAACASDAPFIPDRVAPSGG
ncbi:MAG: 4'-phosphopantetheinyl transferase superfamily protein [Caulobacteraceae bacterium]